MARNALEALIIAEPQNPAYLRVYGDWLQSQGEPAGELIALQLRAEDPLTPDERAARDEAERELMARHSDELVGPTKGFGATWRWGFVRSVRPPLAASDGEVDRIRRQLAAVLNHSASRLLGRLRLDGDRRLPLHALLDIVEEARAPSFDTLDLRQDEIDSELLRRLGELPTRLRRLSLTGLKMPLDALVLPGLKEFEFVPIEMSRTELRTFARAPWPGLTSLRISGLRQDVTAEDLETVLSSLPSLKVLYVGGLDARQQDAFFEGLGYSRAADSLTEVRIGGRSTALPDALIRHAALLERIPRLRLAAAMSAGNQSGLRVLYGDRLAFGQRGL